MAKLSQRKNTAGAGDDDTPALAELRALRKAQRDHSRRVEELKLRLLQLTEHNWDQAVTLIKRWSKDK